MTEPEYIFKKGEGWVLTKTPSCKIIIVEQNGYRLRMENRLPTPIEIDTFGCDWWADSVDYPFEQSVKNVCSIVNGIEDRYLNKKWAEDVRYARTPGSYITLFVEKL